MNEYETDFGTPEDATDKWIAKSAAAVGTICHKAGQEMYHAMHQGNDLYRSARRRIGKEVRSAHSAVNAHPYVSVLVGVGVGVVLGYLATSKATNDPE